MKAARFKSVGQPLSIETVADPTPNVRELVVKVSYCGICGTDLHATREGLTQVCCDTTLGHEFVGEVVEVGYDAKQKFQVGDRVCALPFIACGHCVACANGRPFECQTKKLIGIDAPGGFAEYLATGMNETLILPDKLDLRSAALIEPLAVGLHAVRIAELTAGSSVLITGAGPIGLAVALWSRFFGARHVVVSEIAETRLEMANSMGATHVINGSEDVAEQFQTLTGKLPDIIFECVGAPGLLQQCIEIAPHRGKIIPVGVCEQADSIVPFLALVKELRIVFAIAYTKDDFETTMAMLGEGRINADLMITDEVSLDELPEAFEALREPSHQCKVITAF